MLPAFFVALVVICLSWTKGTTTSALTTGCISYCVPTCDCSSGDIEISSSVTSIESQAFFGKTLTSVIIPSSVIHIGLNAFMWNNIVQVTIPSSVQTIGLQAFYANRLSNVVIPSSVVNVGFRAFFRNRLTRYTIENPNGTTIEPYAFAGQFGILSILAPTTSIDDSFGNALAYISISNSNVDSLLVSVEFPSTLIHIGAHAFKDNSLTTLRIPGTVTSIGEYAFAGNPLQSVCFEGEAIGIEAFPSNAFPSGTPMVCPPTAKPTTSPSVPLIAPSETPTYVPSIAPTKAPTFTPTFTRTRRPTASPSKSALDAIRDLISAQQVSINLLNEHVLTNRKTIEKLQGEMVRKTKDIDAIRQDVVELRQKVKRLKR